MYGLNLSKRICSDSIVASRHLKSFEGLFSVKFISDEITQPDNTFLIPSTPRHTSMKYQLKVCALKELEQSFKLI